jgi:predicted TPR repeat methyltransferase
MIEMAKEKNIYDYLEVNDLMTFFGSNREKFDLFISADVFGYIGELDSIFKGVSETADDRALFLFSVENYDQEEASSSNLSYVVRPSGRVAHSKRYITDLIDQYQFSLEHCEEATIRKDYDRSVSGDLYRLRKL